MAQAKALDALEPFLALSKAATSPRAAADLVTQATSHPNAFVFAELLQTPQIQALATADPEHAAYLTLLKIFSYGTYADYERGGFSSATTTSPLPALSDVQARKLRQLSLISLANDRAHLGYAHLVRALGLDDAGALEALVISAIYAGLVTATLDPAHEVVRISAVAPLRDLAPGAVPDLQAALEAWSGRCEATLSALDEQIAAIRRAAAAKAEADRRWTAQLQLAIEDEKRIMLQRPFEGGGGGGGGDGYGNWQAAAASTSGVAARLKPRFMKRGSNHLAEEQALNSQPGGSSSAGAGGAGAADDGESMELDDDEPAEGSKRASRRKA